MKRSTGRTHVLYSDIQQARADCYHCGSTKPAHHLIWMKHPLEGAYLALCAACHPGRSEDAVALFHARIAAYGATRDSARAAS